MQRKIGILGAMPQEVDDVIRLLQNPKEFSIGMRNYVSGQINGIDAVVVFSRWGKVAAAATVSALIHHFAVTEIIFTGVAGAIDPELKIGDVVIGRRLIQHDLDARPLMQRFEVPLLSKTYFETGNLQLEFAQKAVSEILSNSNLHQLIKQSDLAAFQIQNPKVIVGDIASGDQFFASHLQKEQLQMALPEVLCVEMEGAAVAQVCYEYEIPFVIIRTISDTADDQSHVDFTAFIKKISSKYSAAIISSILKLLSRDSKK